eukprot:symbB.v1.2.025862.t1/scaffold2541.1/size78117/1
MIFFGYIFLSCKTYSYSGNVALANNNQGEGWANELCSLLRLHSAWAVTHSHHEVRLDEVLKKLESSEAVPKLPNNAKEEVKTAVDGQDAQNGQELQPDIVVQPAKECQAAQVELEAPQPDAAAANPEEEDAKMNDADADAAKAELEALQPDAVAANPEEEDAKMNDADADAAKADTEAPQPDAVAAHPEEEDAKMNHADADAGKADTEAEAEVVPATSGHGTCEKVMTAEGPERVQNAADNGDPVDGVKAEEINEDFGEAGDV